MREAIANEKDNNRGGFQLNSIHFKHAFQCIHEVESEVDVNAAVRIQWQQ